MAARKRRRRGRRRLEVWNVELPLRARLRAGAEYGFLMGAVFGALAFVNALFHGGEVGLRGGRTVPLWAVLTAYVVGGPVTGVLFGAAFPLMRWRPAAYLCGAVLSLPLLAFMGASLDGFKPWMEGDYITLAVMVLTLGGIGGLMVREVTLMPLGRSGRSDESDRAT